MNFENQLDMYDVISLTAIPLRNSSIDFEGKFEFLVIFEFYMSVSNAAYRYAYCKNI